ncbi:response regulator [bacterium]|nr:response regulator [bacterium]MBU1637658.1 response regulator [bacterium]MBU1921273.1 response regulator [bacterium]RQV97871.1 MAG: response regulator [bacterium]
MAQVLVIDDDATYRSILREFIEKAGHSVIEAENADDGVSIFLKEKIDLVISDLMMPVKSGMDLLHELQRIDPKVLFILVTGYPTIDTATESIKAGAYDFLVKPVEMNQLTAVMKRALKTLELKSNLTTIRGVNVALLLSVPLWIFAGYMVKVLLMD